MVSRVPVAPRIVDPKIIPLFYELEAKRFFLRANDTGAAVQEPMLINSNRLFLFIFDRLALITFLSTNSKNGIDVPIFCGINMFFNLIPQLFF